MNRYNPPKQDARHNSKEEIAMECKPCPFCGTSPIVFGNGTIECMNDECFIQPTLYNDDWDADEMCHQEMLNQQIEKWNRNLNKVVDPVLFTRAKNTLQQCYMKHVADTPDIGWEELSNELCDTLCEIMGDDEFQKWLENF